MSQLRISTNSETGLSAYIDEASGRAFYTANLLAQLMGTKTQILTQASWFNTVINYVFEFSEVLTDSGFRSLTYLILDEDAYDIIETYISKARKTTDTSQAKELLRKMGKAGCRVYAYSLCGYTMQPQQPQLPRKPQPTAVEYIQAAEKVPNLQCSEALKQLLLDKLGDELSTVQQSQLPQPKEKWLGVAQKAEELGYTIDASTRTTLGRCVSRLAVGGTHELTRRKEIRLCNGTNREIWVYLDCPELEKTIHEVAAIKGWQPKLRIV